MQTTQPHSETFLSKKSLNSSPSVPLNVLDNLISLTVLHAMAGEYILFLAT